MDVIIQDHYFIWQIFCHFLPPFCHLWWTVKWVGYVNVRIEPRGSDKQYLPDNTWIPYYGKFLCSRGESSWLVSV